MSLLNKKKKPFLPTPVESSINRDSITTMGEAKRQLRDEQNAYQENYRKQHVGSWKEAKSEIDNLSFDELAELIADSSKVIDMPRVGMHTMKINVAEYALIKFMMKKLGKRSSRELYLDLVKAEVDKLKNK